MPKPYPSEFRDDVALVGRNREFGVTVEQIAKDFGIHSAMPQKWMHRAVIDEDGGVRHVFAGEAPNELSLVDIAEHKTVEGELYLCAIKDVFSGRIVGCPIRPSTDS